MKLADIIQSHPADWRERWQAFVRARNGAELPALQPRRKPSRPPPQQNRGLPGSKLTKILAGPPFWIAPDAHACKCKARAAQMDAWGVSGCIKNREQIIAWIADEAKSRGFPFASVAAAALVDLAITLAAAEEADVCQTP